jgi:hypothetical protein
LRPAREIIFSLTIYDPNKQNVALFERFLFLIVVLR